MKIKNCWLKDGCNTDDSAAGSSRADPVYHGYRLYGPKETFFVSSVISKRSMVSGISLCLKVPYDYGRKLPTALLAKKSICMFVFMNVCKYVLQSLLNYVLDEKRKATM